MLLQADRQVLDKLAHGRKPHLTQLFQGSNRLIPNVIRLIDLHFRL